MTVRETITDLRRRLLPVFGQGETQAIIRLIFNYLKGWEPVQIFMNEEKPLSMETLQAVNRVAERVLNHEPIQYITGIAPFYGLQLGVDRRVLIPRPETELLVDMIVKKYGDCKDLEVLDLCTGSGCIAIALSRNLPFSRVEALDISSDALEVARVNAAKYKARIRLVESDIFTFLPAPESFDIIVSNPPYIDLSERVNMDRNVLDYEPHQALFVPDEEPVIFYSRIATIAGRGLRPGGALYLEINPRHAQDIRAILATDGFIDINTAKDIHGDTRFVTAFKPSLNDCR